MVTDGFEGYRRCDVCVTPAALCATGSILPLAKMIVHMSSWAKDIGQLPVSAEASGRLGIWG